MNDSQIGKKIANYEIRERIGGGGVGHVFKAVDTTLGRTVAIKVLRPELSARPALVERFRSEAQTVARLNHPNIATVFSLIEDPSGLHMVMEYLEGRTVSGLIRAKGALEIDAAFEIFHQALDGIRHAHLSGVVHRDIKGSNLMLTPQGSVKVMDFGIARVLGSERMTRVGNLVGTPEYMSPEQIRGEDATIASDIYSLAILLFEMLTGQVPFPAQGGEYDVMRAQVEQPAPSPREIRKDIPEGVAQAILRALEKAPALRFTSTRDFQEALVDGGAPEPVAPSRPSLAAIERVPEADGYEVDPDAPTLQPERPPQHTHEVAPVATLVEEEAPTRNLGWGAWARRGRLALWPAAALLTAGLAFALVMGSENGRQRILPHLPAALARLAPGPAASDSLQRHPMQMQAGEAGEAAEAQPLVGDALLADESDPSSGLPATGADADAGAALTPGAPEPVVAETAPSRPASRPGAKSSPRSPHVAQAPPAAPSPPPAKRGPARKRAKPKSEETRPHAPGWEIMR